MKNIFVVFLSIFLLTGCVTLNIEGVRSDGCAWVTDLYLSKPSATALLNAQQTNPEVRVDRERIASHNKNWQKNCNPSEE